MYSAKSIDSSIRSVLQYDHLLDRLFDWHRDLLSLPHWIKKFMENIAGLRMKYQAK